MTEIQQMQTQLTEAFGRIQHLEDEIKNGKELPRWQYLVSRPHRWPRQLSVKGRNMTVGQLVSTIRANRYTPEQASDDFAKPPAIK